MPPILCLEKGGSDPMGLISTGMFFTLLLLRLLDSLLPLLLPPPLLWLLLQLPAAKHHGPKGRTKSKMYVSRGRNVPSEILQKACRCYCHGRRSGCCRSSRQQNTMALKDGPMSKMCVSYCYCCCWSHCCRCYCRGCCSGCCCSSRQQNTMALKDGPSPKCVFLTATAAVGVTAAAATATAAAAAPGSKTPWP